MNKNKYVIKRVTEFSPLLGQAMRSLTPQEGNNYQPLSDDDIIEMLNTNCHYLYVAIDQKSENIVGMITVIIHRIPYAKKAVLEDLVVDEKFRSYGLGRRLMETAVQLAQQEKVSYIDFTSQPYRKTANAFYSQFGFSKRNTNVYRLYIK